MTAPVLPDTLLLGFPEYVAPAQRLAKQLNCPYEQVAIHRFPDGESKVRLPASLPRHVILCRSLDHPNDKLVELLLTAETARAAGVQRLTLVAPYLCYMRQDMAFHPGEAVSQRIIGRWLAGLFDTVITVDPHLHRVKQLSEAVPARRSISLSAGPLLAAFLHQRIGKALLVGPDSESRQWVEQIAGCACMEYLVAEKQRFSDKDVHIKLPAHNLRDRAVVIVDDVASTARTLAVTAQQLLGAGATEIHCCITHAIFAEDAEAVLRSAGISHIWSSDSILHSSNTIELCGILAAAVTG
ncbi:MAG: ribose-phosphate diphosphokinase [Gammaproteobacteria bacterium]|jgi:ribose-phosphate pyrophosphokinase